MSVNGDDVLKLIFESAKDFAIFTMDPNGIATSWNVGAERLLGYKAEEILGHSVDVIFPVQEGGRNAAEEERRVALACGRAEDERWQQRQDGTLFWASGLLMPLADRTQGFVKILRDRTPEHYMEERLRQSEELFRLLAVNVPQLVFRSRGTGHRTWASPQWCIFTGMTFAESLELGWLEAVHPDDHPVTVAAWKAAASSGQYYAEHRIRRSADAQFRWHQTRAVRLESEQSPEREWVGTSTDIHELRSLQSEQKVLVAELQHRTRNLLAVVQAMARNTLRSSSSLREFRGEFESRLRALSRVQGLLARSDHTEIDLRDLIESELKAHGGEASMATKIELNGPSLMLPGSSAQPLALALHELSTNAVKYGALGQPTGMLRVTWTVESGDHDQRVRLNWVEEGVEMPTMDERTRKGYGTELIKEALPYQLDAATKLEFHMNGVRCEITAPIRKSAAGTRP